VNCNSFLLFGTSTHSFTLTALKSDLLKVSKSTVSAKSGSISTLEKSIFSTGFVSVFTDEEVFLSGLRLLSVGN